MKTRQDVISMDIECITIVCPICGLANENVQIRNVNGRYTIVKCRTCRLVYTNPMPLQIPDDIRQVYDGWDYHAAFLSDLGWTLKIGLSEFKRQQDFLAKRNLVPAAGRFLDIGCGVGHIVAAAKKAGWSSYGLEIDEKSYELTKKTWDLDIRPCFLNDAGFPKEYFHWIRARYVFEHLSRPKDLLRDIWNALVPGGIVLIDVPNQSGFAAQRRIRKGISQGMGQVYGYLDPPIHVVGYSPETMRRLLEKEGFTVPLSMSTFPGSSMFRPECGPSGWLRTPYIFAHYILSKIGRGSISVTCGQKPPVGASK